jgi:c-di-GMP-binding flagellar brake protein YcgR
LPILLFLIAIFGLVFLFFLSKSGGFGRQWVTFFKNGKEAGFSFKEVELLRHIALQNNLTDPCAIYVSQDQLGICIRSIIKRTKMSGEGDEYGTQDFLSRLYDFRKKIEMSKPAAKRGITNSRQINEGQFLRVLVSGTGVYQSQVVKNVNQFLTISRPSNPKNTTHISWQGEKISVYFWREDDAGYVFDTSVIDEVFSLGVSSLKISHSDSLFRTQKRKSIRVKMNKTAYLYLVPDGQQPHKIETKPGLKCFIEDISETGCAVVVAGKANTDLRVKIQFSLSNRPVCISGIIRSAAYKEDKNRSTLRIEAENLPIETRNLILGEVFGTSEEDDEDLPFRVLDDEAEKMSAQAVPSVNDDPFAAQTNAMPDNARSGLDEI